MLRRNASRPSGRLTTVMRAVANAGLYSRPAARKASGPARLTRSPCSSAGRDSSSVISARSGSPSADCTVMRPSDSAQADVGSAPAIRQAAASATA
jgi:hypothetical protein